MIVRILGEGQYEVDADHLEHLNEFDAQIEKAVASEDSEAFRAALSALLTEVREAGTPVPVETIEPSELVLPAAESTISDVRAMLSGEGLLPG